jgi:hypothetical protein
MTDWTTDIPGYATALGTLVLATATFYLASKTRESVNENKTLITQGESLVTEAQRQSASAEESAKAAKAQAEFTSNLYLAASQPLLHLLREDFISIDRKGAAIELMMTFQNEGTGAALLGPPLEAPQLSVEWTPNWEPQGVLSAILVPVQGVTQVTFTSNATNAPSPPAAGEVRNASARIWYMDIAKSHRRVIEMKFEVTFKGGPYSSIGHLRLVDVDYGSPAAEVL